MNEQLYLYPVWLRIWHWINALLFIFLIITGISMHYSNPDSPFIAFSKARAIHNVCGIILAIMYLYFFIGNLISGNWRHYKPRWCGFINGLVNQSKYYLFGIFKNQQHPYHPSNKTKFNPLQQITYIKIMYILMPILITTGLLLIFPELAPEKAFGAGGIWPVAVLHTAAGFISTIFMIGHIYLATTGESIIANFKGMITGWHLTGTGSTNRKLSNQKNDDK